MGRDWLDSPPEPDRSICQRCMYVNSSRELKTHYFYFGKLEETGARILEIDFLDESTIERAAREYGDQPLDVLVNVGGRRTPVKHTFISFFNFNFRFLTYRTTAESQGLAREYYLDAHRKVLGHGTGKSDPNVYLVHLG